MYIFLTKKGCHFVWQPLILISRDLLDDRELQRIDV